jgi:non-specific serine/threonine protein kinase
LLSAAEQHLFDRLSVFSGGWTLEAAEAICTGDDRPSPAVLDLLSSLVDHSLVQVKSVATHAVRYTLHEIARAYSREHLQADPAQAEATAGRHAVYFLAMVEAIPYWTLLAGPDQLALLAEIEEEHDNLRAALRWFIAHRDAERAYHLAGWLGRFWFLQGHLSEGRAWLAELLADSEAVVTPLARAKVVYAAGQVALFQGDFAGAAPFTRESLALWRTLELPREEAYSLYVLGIIALRTGDQGQAQEWFEQALATSVTAPNPEVEGVSTCYLGELAFDTGELARARTLAQRALDIADRIRHLRLKPQALSLLGAVSHEQGDDRAE